MEENENKKLRCESCRREIQLGEDLWTVEKGVSGPRGVVPLGKVMVFCGEEHVRNYFDNGENDSGADIGFRIPY